MKPTDKNASPSTSSRKPTTRKPIDPTLAVMRRAGELLLTLQPDEQEIALRYLAGRVDQAKGKALAASLVPAPKSVTGTGEIA